MRVGIDGRALSRDMGGMGRYLLELMKELEELMPLAHFFLYVRNASLVPGLSTRWTIRTDRSLARRLPGPSWSRFGCARLARPDKLDVFWAAAGIAPIRLGQVPVVTTVYDLNHLVFPASMPAATRFGHRLWLEKSLRESHRCVSISKGTAQRVRDAYGIDCDAVVVPGIGAGFVTRHTPTVADDMPAYILSVATREPRKNLGALVRAVKLINDSRKSPIELWLVGGRGWGNAFSSEEASALSATWCRVLGYVSDADLPALYANARVFAFPSIYEGYGIPVSEARSQGTPIVTSDIPELREAGGEYAIYTGTTAESIREGLELALLQPRGITHPTDHANVWRVSAEIMAHQLVLAASHGRNVQRHDEANDL